MSQKKPVEIPKLSANTAGTHIRENMKMYWGGNHPQAEDAVKALIEQLTILDSKGIKSFKHDEWYFVGAKTDWIASGLTESRTVEELFKKGAGFSEAGGLSLRSELFTYEFAEDLALWRNGEVILLKGQRGDDLEVVFSQSYSNGVAICFRGNTYEDGIKENNAVSRIT